MLTKGLRKGTITLLRQLRIDQLSRMFDKVLIIERLWDGNGQRPYTLSISEEENMNKALELEEAQQKIAANLSNPVTEIAKMEGVFRREAENILKQDIKVNKKYQASMQQEQKENKGDNND